MAGVVKVQTIKEAKASFKSRGRPSLSAKEQRQLERSVELEQRAEKARESEKRRAEAAKKRSLSERKQVPVLGSQRTADKFGFKASQFHLGAFFRKPSPGQAKARAEDEDAFGDEDLEDEELLKVLDATQSAKHVQSARALMPPPPPPPQPPPAHSRPEIESLLVTDEDMSNIWDELDSSTQIARDLETDRVAEPAGNPRVDSFSSGDFDDLTAADLDELDPPTTVVPVVEREKCSVMPPPPLFAKPVDTAIWSPAIATKRTTVVDNPTPRQQVPVTKQQNAIRGPFMPASTLYCSPDLGFTFTQLETFIDDDIQLTQAMPG